MGRTDILDDRHTLTGKLVRLAWPTVLSMFFHTSYSLVNMLWVSSLGHEAIAAVTLTGIVLWAVFGISQIFASGVLALVARALGGQHRDKAERAFSDGLVASMIAGIPITLVMYLLPGPILRVLGADPAVCEMGVTYLRMMAIGSLASMTLFTLSSAFRGAGDMVVPLILTGTACVLNAVLDPIFIFGAGPIPAMGLPGAGVATSISLFFGLAWGLSASLRKGAILKFRFHLLPDWPLLKDVFVIGVPAGLHYILLSLTQSVMIWMVASFGMIEVAVTGIGSRITELSFLPCFGIGMATAAMVGQYLGAGRIRDAERTVAVAMKLTLAVTAAIAGLLVLRSDALLRVFSSEPEMLQQGTVYLRLFAVTMLFIAATITLVRVFQGAGDTLWPTAVAAARLVSFVLFGWLFGWVFHMKAVGVWTAMLVSGIVQALMMWWLYSLGTWKRKKIKSLEPAAIVEPIEESV